VNDVYVPKDIRYRNLAAPQDVNKRTSFTRDIHFTRQKVNEPIDESEFSLERMGLRPGDTVNDNLRGVVYQFGDPNPTSTNMRTASRSWVWIVVAVNVVFFVLVAIVIVSRKRLHR
jgi:hypothetical protein